jgi:hypothetical protein
VQGTGVKKIDERYYLDIKHFYSVNKTTSIEDKWVCLKDCPGCARVAKTGTCHIHKHFYSTLKEHYSNKNFDVRVGNKCGSRAYSPVINFRASELIPDTHTYTANSPLGLVISPEIKNPSDLPVNFANFKLSEEQTLNSKVKWLGSSNFAVLVWDPDNKGEIDDGRSLFGTWSFGRKWNNGYEALASLDEDQDGQVSKEELNGIKLWLDQNSNAKVDRTEIHELTAHGITEISVVGQELLNNPFYGLSYLYNNNGYRYKKDDKELVGLSVDWFQTKEPVDNLKIAKQNMNKEGYTVYEFAQEPISFGANKINGYVALRQKNGRYEAKAIGAVKIYHDLNFSEALYDVHFKDAKVTDNKSNLTIEFAGGIGQKTILVVNKNQNDSFSGDNVTFDSSEFYKSIGGISKVINEDGSSPTSEKITSKVRFEEAKTEAFIFMDQ